MWLIDTEKTFTNFQEDEESTCRMHIGQIVVELKTGDILQANTDVIVNSTDPSFDLEGMYYLLTNNHLLLMHHIGLGILLTYAGTVKRHNVCKRHVSIDTGFKQTERAIFLHVIPNRINIRTALKYIFEETVPKLSVNFGNRNSQDSLSQEPISRF